MVRAIDLPFSIRFEVIYNYILGWPKKVHFFEIRKFIFLKMTSIGVILCGESIARIHEPWKRFLDPDLWGKWVFEEKSVFFRISQQIRKKIIFASKTQFFLESGSGKRFHASGMLAIDFSHEKPH